MRKGTEDGFQAGSEVGLYRVENKAKQGWSARGRAGQSVRSSATQQAD